MSLSNNIESQIIDTDGKCVCLNYSEISLFISPQAPFKEENVGEDEYFESELHNALGFIQEKNLKIEGQSIQDEKLVGIWVKNEFIAYGYIPIAKSEEKLKDVEIVKKPVPCIKDENSRLENMRNNKKIAEFLKQYSLIEWSKNQEDFGENNFTVDPDHDYDIKNLSVKIQRGNSHIYDGKKIIVPDRETIQRLLTYVYVTCINNKDYAEFIQKKNSISPYDIFTSPIDFKQRPGQTVFIGRESVRNYKQSKAREIINSQIFSHIRNWSKEPYYYKNPKVLDGRICIIQNTYDGSLPTALTISKAWYHKKINEGYQPKNSSYEVKVIETENFDIYTEEDGLTFSVKRKGPLLNIIVDDNGDHCAILDL